MKPAILICLILALLGGLESCKKKSSRSTSTSVHVNISQGARISIVRHGFHIKVEPSAGMSMNTLTQDGEFQGDYRIGDMQFRVTEAGFSLGENHSWELAKGDRALLREDGVFINDKRVGPLPRPE